MSIAKVSRIVLNERGAPVSTNYKPLLNGIGIAGYRSIAEWQELIFDSKVTTLAGVNNSGKSNVLRFLQDVLPKLRTDRRRLPTLPKFEGLDKPSGFAEQASVRIGIPISTSNLRDLTPREISSGTLVGQHGLEAWQHYAMKLLGSDGWYWSICRPGDSVGPPNDRVAEAVKRWPEWPTQSRNVLHALSGGSTKPESVMENLLTSLGGFEKIPRVSTIAASRRVEIVRNEEVASSSGSVEWLSGRGIIDELFKLQLPNHQDWAEATPRWEALNRFLQVVLGDSEARIHIPHDASTIQVATPTRVLPLANLGSGVEQVIILGAAATVIQNNLVCIEEPETNLHPLLQKKLIRYLTEETNNQYVIATHSSHLLDDARASVYHLRLKESGTTITRARKPYEMVAICNDLGYRPSDLMQANAVIWVEGPSDRIYIRQWLKMVDPELAEGIDYSIMFYGGKLISHLSVDEHALQQFIDLRKLNRHSAIVIDSDRSSSRKQLGTTKTRIRDEYLNSPGASGFAWITEGYTIENYIPVDLLRQSASEVHPQKPFHIESQRWDNPFPGSGWDKVSIAHKVAERLTEEHLKILDLKKQVTALATFVREANIS
ncbi:AAA family ATPase [Nocardia higoensis]|uniref:AAA family ATPase n=1 Tax=Nocardia higoensis TaxID=228599 RepID=UPI0012F69B40|nr:AAA family ATPase [Nocardia higoensis]